MSNIKVWADDQWKLVGSGDATGISTNNAGLLEDGESNISVFTALERLSEWKDKSKAYIAWLAKNGGGGSGGGGGSTVTEATCTIKVTGQDGTAIESGGTVVLGSNGITIQLADIDVKIQKQWTVTVRVGSRQVAVKTASYTVNSFTLSQDDIASFLENHTGALAVTAVYEDNTNAIYGAESWGGSIVENVVEISCEDTDTTVDGSSGNMSNKTLDFTYSVGYLGDSSVNNYRFTIELSKDGTLMKTYTEDIKIASTKKLTKSVALIPNLFDKASEDYIGVYDVKTTLMSITNSSIASSCTSNLTIASDDILIATTAMAKWDDDHTESGYYPQASIAGSYMIDFTAYVNGGTSYYYYISVDDSPIITGATGKFSTKVQQSISLTNKEWAVAGNVSKIKLEIYTSSGKTGKSAVAYYGIEFIEATSSLLQERTAKSIQTISGMSARDYSSGTSEFTFQNDDYLNGGVILPITSSLTSVNGNALSVIHDDNVNAPYLRLSNGAALKNHDWVYGDVTHTFKEIFPESSSAVKELTISCCFKADYHADDYRTILFCGTINSDTYKMISGISIDVHDIYINGNSVCKLTDNTINIVDIVILQATVTKPKTGGGTEVVTSYIAKVYVDGVMTAIQTLSSFPFPRTTDKVDEIYLGCRVTSTGTMCYNCDCNIYNYKVYDTALSDYDIMINYINNKVLTEYYTNGQPGFSHIDSELQKNFCERDTNNNVSSLIYDVNSDKYSLSSLTIDSSTGTTFNSQLLEKAKSIGIPMMIIDVSADPKWTFAEFSNQQAYGSVTLSPSENRRIVYWDPSASDSSIFEFTGNIELQGHSTLADFVKNINITLPDTTMFIPKETWFPEKVYTLKADVVDSSHSNNAAIGQFINEALGPDENGEGSLLPFDDTAISNVYTSNYKKNQQTGVTLKHTVTGFPVLLLMKFYVSTSSTVGITPLGIYSFNLGRDAYRNLGFKKVNSIEFNDKIDQKVETFPFLSKDATVNETDSNADWIEIANTSTMDITKIVDTLPENFDSSLGDFWQNNENILNSRFEVRYPANTAVSSRTKFKDTFVAGIMELPIEGCASSNVLGNYSIPRIVDTYNTYKCDSDGTNYEVNGTCTMNSDPNHFNGEAMGFNPSSFYMYFNVALLFGLEDNFGKNSTYRSWNGGNYYIDFYDMDSGNGNSNQGELTIGPDMWLKYLYNVTDGTNSYGYAAETFDPSKALQSSSETKVSANQNKLWLSLDTDIARSVFTDSHTGSSRYADYWADLMTSLEAKASTAGYTYDENNPSNPIVDWFMEDYFEAQTKSCGPLLFNLDYKLKYLMQFTSDTYGNTSALPKLHGRKIAYTKNWLTKHIQFMNSLYSWRGGVVMNYVNDVDTSASNTVTTTRNDFPVTMNTPVIFRSNIGDSAKAFYFAPENTKVWTNAGNNAGGSVLTWIINNSPCIIELGDDETKLSEMSIQTIKANNAQYKLNFEGLPSLTVLDLSNNTAFSQSFDLTAFTKGAISELREIDFSNTKSSNGAKFNLDLTFNEGESTYFTKLTKINISNSTCINQVTIPRIPLEELNITNSSIPKFILTNQAYLEDVDLTGCSNLTTVEISGCSKYKKLSLSSYSQLSSVNVNLCDAIEEIVITECPSLTKISIENCNALKKITINNCINLTGADDSLHISGCSALEELNLKGCVKVSTFYLSTSNQEGIKTLNLANTLVKYISGDDASEDLLDLYTWKSLSSFNIQNNTAVEYIQFANDTDTAIPINTSFNKCSNLKRTYGHVILNTTSVYSECTGFSIHGTDLSAVRYNGQSVLSSGRVKMPYEFVTNGLTNFTKVMFNSGKGVTNMDFGNTSLASNFYGTSCSTFDVYYVLSNCPNATSLGGTFMSLSKAPFSWSSSADNSPNRYMFKWCPKVTSLYQTFYGGNNNYIRLFTPTVTTDDEGNETITDNGLFSPLIDTLANVQYIFSGYTIMTNRYLFRHSSKDYKLPVESLNVFTVSVMYEDSNTTGYTKPSEGTPPTTNIEKYGNFTDFYKNLPNIGNKALTAHMSGLWFLDVDTLRDVPCTGLSASFCSSYGKGTIELGSIFKTPASVTAIEQSFRITNTSGDYKVDFPLTNDTFSALTSFNNLGYRTSNSGKKDSGNAISQSSFYGGGINKYINQSTFPYDIIPASIKSKIVNFNGLFIGCNAGSMTEECPELPGSMFEGCTNLVDVSALFYNMNFKYKLTGNSFKDCKSLRRVQYLFAASTDRKNYISGSIPAKLFYHGDTTVSKTLQGIKNDEGNSVTVDPTNGSHWIIVKNGSTYNLNVVSGVANWTDADGNAVSASDILDTETISYYKPNATISDMTCCFQNVNTDAFFNGELSDDSKEKNENYMPFIATFASNKFTTQTPNMYEYTGAWSWDGNYIEHNFLEDAENLDAPSTIQTGTYYDIVTSSSPGCTLGFCCAPDLLRYSASDCGVTSLFANSGNNAYGSTDHYGLKGRIPPYLLYPLRSASAIDLKCMFQNCQQLSYYIDGDYSYIVPEKMFTYCSNIAYLTYTFRGLSFPNSINLNVFSAIPSTVLKGIEGIFYGCYYYGGSASSRALISNVFVSHKNLSNIKWCFAASQGTTWAPTVSGSYVKFSNVFPSSFATLYYSNGNFLGAFAGYVSGYVEHENPKTLADNSITYNYRYSKFGA